MAALIGPGPVEGSTVVVPALAVARPPSSPHPTSHAPTIINRAQFRIDAAYRKPRRDGAPRYSAPSFTLATDPRSR